MNSSLVQLKLQDSLFHLLEDKSFDLIKIEDIARGAHISRRNFYRYYQDKYDLLNKVVEEHLVSRIISKPTDNVWSIYPQVCALTYKDQKFWRNAINVTGFISPRSAVYQMLKKFVVKDFAGTYLHEDSLSVYLSSAVNLLFGYMDKWLHESPMRSPLEFATYVRDSFKLHIERELQIIEESIEMEKTAKK